MRGGQQHPRCSVSSNSMMHSLWCRGLLTSEYSELQYCYTALGFSSAVSPNTVCTLNQWIINGNESLTPLVWVLQPHGEVRTADSDALAAVYMSKSCLLDDSRLDISRGSSESVVQITRSLRHVRNSVICYVTANAETKARLPSPVTGCELLEFCAVTVQRAKEESTLWKMSSMSMSLGVCS